MVLTTSMSNECSILKISALGLCEKCLSFGTGRSYLCYRLCKMCANSCYETGWPTVVGSWKLNQPISYGGCPILGHTLNFYKPYGSSARFLLFVLVSYSLLFSLQLLFFLQKFFAELLSLLLQILHSIASSAFLKTNKTLHKWRLNFNNSAFNMNFI